MNDMDRTSPKKVNQDDVFRWTCKCLEIRPDELRELGRTLPEIIKSLPALDPSRVTKKPAV